MHDNPFTCGLECALFCLVTNEDKIKGSSDLTLFEITSTKNCWCCSSTSTAPKDDRGDAAGGSGRHPSEPLASGSSSLTDLPAEAADEEECSGTSRRMTLDSEEDGFSFNEDETESQEVCVLALEKLALQQPG